MISHRIDRLNGLNPDQSGPKDKIQNGDPRSSPNRDQRSGAKESGGPGESLQKEPTLGSNRGSVIPPQETSKVEKGSGAVGFPEGVKGEHEPSDALDRAGVASYSGGEPVKEKVDADQGPKKSELPEEAKTDHSAAA